MKVWQSTVLCPPALFFFPLQKIFWPFVLLSSIFLGTISPAQATITAQIMIDETLVVYDIPKGYTNAPQHIVNAIKDEYDALDPAGWVDLVAAYVPEADATKLSPKASERLAVFLELDLIPQFFSPQEFRALNAPAAKFLASDYCLEREILIENCSIALSRPQILHNTGKQFTVGFLETFSCPSGMTWTMTITTRFRVQNKKVVTIHQLCTSKDYRDILTFKKHYASALANLRLR